jgi:hypothetical protein
MPSHRRRIIQDNQILGGASANVVTRSSPPSLYGNAADKNTDASRTDRRSPVVAWQPQKVNHLRSFLKPLLHLGRARKLPRLHGCTAWLKASSSNAKTFRLPILRISGRWITSSPRRGVSFPFRTQKRNISRSSDDAGVWSN